MHTVFINLTIYLFISGYYLSRVFFLSQCFKSCLPLKDKLIVIKFKTGQLFCLYEEKLVSLLRGCQLGSNKHRKQ